MKKFLLLVLFVFAIGTSYAQTASDYYMPMCVGNHSVFQTDATLEYWGRISTFTFIGTDIIEGEVYYVEQGIEYVYEEMAPPSIFRIIWMRVNENGDIVVKAFSESSPIIDSAYILPTELIIFSDNFLTEGYSLTQTLSPGETIIDSVISTHAAYVFFNNCIQVRETNKSNGVIGNVDDTYYAYGIGRVGVNRIVGNIHSDSIDGIFITGCDPIIDTLPPPVVDTCIGEFFEYYVRDVLVDTVSNIVTVTWVFQDSEYTLQFVESYTYQGQGNYVISITLECNGKKASETFYKPIWISSSPLGMNDAAKKNPVILIYPNPAADMITIGNTNNQTAVLSIYNVMGGLVKTETINQDPQQIDLGNLSNGIYVVEVKSKDYTETQKLIIQR